MLSEAALAAARAAAKAVTPRVAKSEASWASMPAWSAVPVRRTVSLQVFREGQLLESLLLTSVKSLLLGRQANIVDE